MPIINHDGLFPAPEVAFQGLADTSNSSLPQALALSVESDINALRDRLESVQIIKINFDTHADGRGFSQAVQLRNIGFGGTLRATGELIQDQYDFALACGFDEIEIDDLASADSGPVLKPEKPGLSYQRRLGSSELLPEPDENTFSVRVLDVEHYNASLFRFRVTRPDAFRFQAGEFTLLGLPVSDRIVYRPYSIVSASWDDTIEFYSIKVPDGELTSLLQWINTGDTLYLKKKATGSLVLHALQPGKRLFLHSTGTGIAPFISLIQEPELYERYEEIVLTHTCRYESDLNFSRDKLESIKNSKFVGESVRKQLHFHATTTRSEPNAEGHLEKISSNRITEQIRSGDLISALELDPIDTEHDRVMICGSKAVSKDLIDIYVELGMTPGSLSRPGTLVWERAFVD